MRIWMENPFDNLPGSGGRAGRYEMMARAFAEAGHEVVWWTADFAHTTKRRRSECDIPPDLGFAIRLIPTKPYSANVSLSRIASHRAYARSWLRACLNETDRPDVLIVSSPPLATAAAAIGIRNRLGCRLVADVQDLWPETFHRLLPDIFKPLASTVFAPAGRMADKLYRAADLTTCVTESYVRPLERRGAAAIRVFRLGIDLPPAATRNGRLSLSSLRLCYLGNLGHGYDLQTVLEALKNLPGSTLSIAGAGEQESALLRTAERLGVLDRVNFAGYLGADAMRRFLEDSDVGIIPMKGDSFVGIPNKMADYAAAGLPIVSSLDGECADLIAKYRCGATYRPGDADNLANAIMSLDDSDGNRARSMAEDIFDARRIYRDYVNEITELFGK